MTCNYSVTFEYDRQPPKTHRGTVTAFSVNTCMSRATKEATKAVKPVGWSSCVCVLLDRVQVLGSEGAEANLSEGSEDDSEGTTGG